MDQNCLLKSVEYHGSQLIDAIRIEQGENAVKSITPKQKDTSPSAEKSGSNLNENKKALLASFIAKKADMLFKPYKHSEFVVNSAIELEDKDKYAILPPIECFMNVEVDVRKKHFYNTLMKGDVVIGRVAGKHIHGLIITLLCLNAGKMRFIDDLNLKCFCHLHHIPQVSAHEDPLDEFNVNDLIQGVVNEIVVETEKIYISMIESAFPHVTQLHLKLGLITDDDLPVHFKKSSKFCGESYESSMVKTLGFMNPSIVSQLSMKMGVNLKRCPSLMRGLHDKEYPRADYAVELYKTQCAQWAYKSVKQGVDYFKSGNNLEAFQCLNKALQIDPENVEAFVARGALYANNNGLSRALEDFEKALEIDSNHVNARKFIVTTLLAHGKHLEDDGKIEEAIKNYKRAVALNPNCVEAVQYLKQSQKKLAEQEMSRIRSQEAQKEESQTSDSKSSKREPTTKERLRQLLSVDRVRHDSDKQRDKKKQKSMSPIDISTSTSDSSSDSSSTESSSSSAFEDSGKSRKRKNGNRNECSKSKSKAKSLERKSVCSDNKRSSSAYSKPTPRSSGDTETKMKNNSSVSKRRESNEVEISLVKSCPSKPSQRRDSMKTTLEQNSKMVNNRTGTYKQSFSEYSQSASRNSTDASEGRFTDSKSATTNTSGSKNTNLNELESFFATLKAAKSASTKKELK